jgi:hypothetical protein
MFLALAPNQGPLLPAHGSASSPPLFGWHDAADAQRAEVERFIQRVYARRFGARVLHFAPNLVSLRDRESGAVVAAAGYRQASAAPLFLERYLEQPVEQGLCQPGAQPPSRDGIFEVGHLAAERAGEGRRLIVLMAQHLAERRAQWVVSTLTEELRHLFVRLGITPLALGRADATALGDEASEWGSYYEHHPVVLAGQVQHALRLFERRRRAQETGQ